MPGVHTGWDVDRQRFRSHDLTAARARRTRMFNNFARTITGRARAKHREKTLLHAYFSLAAASITCFWLRSRLCTAAMTSHAFLLGRHVNRARHTVRSFRDCDVEIDFHINTAPFPYAFTTTAACLTRASATKYRVKEVEKIAQIIKARTTKRRAGSATKRRATRER